MLSRIPPILRLLVIALLALTLLLMLMRVGFWLWFNNPAQPLSLNELLHSFYIGLKFDLRLALLIMLPLLLLHWVPGLSPFRPLGATLWSGYAAVVTLMLLGFYALDFGHYAYLGIRVDSTVLRFSSNPLIAAEMVWQSYAVIPIIMALLGGSIWVTQRCYSALGRWQQAPYHPLQRWPKVAVYTTAILIYLLGIYGQLSWYPLRWSDAFYNTNPFAAAVAVNPILYFNDTFTNGGISYDEEAVKEGYPLIATYLNSDPIDHEALNYRRITASVTPWAQPPNVVVVILESFAAYKASLSGNALPSTPNFDAIARQGIYFNNFFTPHTGTARSVFAFTTGIPDVQLNDTSSRNPTIVKQHLLFNAFEGYEKLYFLGGSASWRNIRALLSTNIPNLHLYEEGSYSAPRVDVWGISDLDLFKEANQALKQQTQPFFAVIQTSGNHRPYTIPMDNDGFVAATTELDVTAHGFESVEEYNSYRFMDHSIGRFMELSKDEGYFDRTIFAFFGDHGINHDAGQHSAQQETLLGLTSYRVPFVIYAPALLAGGRIAPQIASEVDVMTTLATLAGHPHINTTMGRDLLDTNYTDRSAFTISHSSNPLIGVIRDGYYLQQRADGSQQTLYRLGEGEGRTNHMETQPQRAESMARFSRAYYETARYMMNNNQPISESTESITP